MQLGLTQREQVSKGYIPRHGWSFLLQVYHLMTCLGSQDNNGNIILKVQKNS
jgi:hypothetical protein